MTTVTTPMGTIDNCPYCGKYTKPGDIHMVCPKQPQTTYTTEAEGDAYVHGWYEGRKTMWEPIDTAPTDKHVLVFPALLDVPATAIFDSVRGFWRLTMTEKKIPFNPTHWMELPECPKQ